MCATCPPGRLSGFYKSNLSNTNSSVLKADVEQWTHFCTIAVYPRHFDLIDKFLTFNELQLGK